MNKTLLSHYAEAFFSVAKDDDKVIPYGNDLLFIKQIFHDVPDFVLFLSSPLVTRAEKIKTIDDLKDNINKATQGFLLILVKKGLIKGFDLVEEAYQHCYRKSVGILEGKLYTPFEVSVPELKQIESVFSNKFAQRVVLNTVIDKRVVAGMKIYIGDVMYDYSIDTKLNNIRQKLIVRD
ncbi:MAG: ATP synthase F1 subunit delta [Bacilli bacterium]|jgi:F-type H+-transporting ATPase subunit delta